jgi:hypothetical protein
MSYSQYLPTEDFKKPDWCRENRRKWGVFEFVSSVDQKLKCRQKHIYSPRGQVTGETCRTEKFAAWLRSRLHTQKYKTNKTNLSTSVELDSAGTDRVGSGCAVKNVYRSRETFGARHARLNFSIGLHHALIIWPWLVPYLCLKTRNVIAWDNEVNKKVNMINFTLEIYDCS